jgi:hypothetical protein
MQTDTRELLVRMARRAALAAMLVGLVGCAAVKMPPANAAAGTVESLRGAALAPAGTGSFTLASGRPAEMDRSLGGLRGSSVSPASGSFAQQLKEQLITDLRAAGLYDEASKVVIEGQLTDSRVDAAIGTGTGRLAARFLVKRAGATVYDKELAVEEQWESSFVGAVALPAAVNHYTAFYPALTRKLADDPDFRNALRK